MCGNAEASFAQTYSTSAPKTVIAKPLGRVSGAKENGVSGLVRPERPSDVR